MNNDFEEENNVDLPEIDESSYPETSPDTGQIEDVPSEDIQEEYYPEEYNSNTSYGRYKMRQEQLEKESEIIKQRQLQRAERNKAFKEDTEDADKHEESSKTDVTNDTSDKGNNQNEKNDNDKKDENKSGKESSSDDKKENGLRSKIDNVGGKIDEAKSKINQVQQTANKVAHPINATKDEIKKKVEKKVVNFLLEWWWVVAIAAAVMLILLIILLILLGSDDGEDDIMLDPTYDISYTMVNITNNYQRDADKIELDRVSLEDYALGAAYLEFYDKLDGKTDTEKLEIYKAYFIVVKSQLLAYGGYNYTTKEITIKNGSSINEVPSCDIDFGCKKIKHDRVYTYVSANSTVNIPGEEVERIDAASESEKYLLRQAYKEVKYLLLVPNSIDTILTEYYFDAPDFNDTIRDKWIETDKKYEKIIKNTSEYNSFKIYNLMDYINAYSYGSATTYWWPIGSREPSDAENNIYGGTPSITSVAVKYGKYQVGDETKDSRGIDIVDASCSEHVIVATREGKVYYMEDGISDENETLVNDYSYGNFVMLYHGDGIYSVYAHLKKNSIVVKPDEVVKQGQMIGIMGSSGSTSDCRLHFELYVNSAQTDPLEYINAENPRPQTISPISSVDGENNKQTVCLSLKSSNFNNNAVAAIMTNIQAESSFNPTIYGDKGTSYGLCQWHNGRFDALKNYCSNDYTTIKCQLEYLLYELQQSYKPVYNMLLTNNSAYDMADYYCKYFEVPQDREINCPKRAGNYASSMLSYVNSSCK